MKKKVAAILTADMHLRDSTPVSRIDNYFAAQEKKIKFLKTTQEKYACPILDAGDVFHKWNSSAFLEAWTIENMPHIKTIAGNHELPNHNIDLLFKSSLNVLKASQRVDIMSFRDTHIFEDNNIKVYGFSYGVKLEKITGDKDKINIAIIHDMISDKSEMFETKDAEKLLKEFDCYDVILSGHNHKSFAAECGGRILINPGSMMRMTADQINHKPKLYLLYNDCSFEAVEFPIEGDVFSTEHIDEKKKKDKRIQTFVNSLSSEYEVDVNFKMNLESFFKKNKTREAVQKMIWEVIDG